MATIEELSKLVINGKKSKVKVMCEEMLKEGVDPLVVILISFAVDRSYI